MDKMRGKCSLREKKKRIIVDREKNRRPVASREKISMSDSVD